MKNKTEILRKNIMFCSVSAVAKWNHRYCPDECKCSCAALPVKCMCHMSVWNGHYQVIVVGLYFWSFPESSVLLTSELRGGITALLMSPMRSTTHCAVRRASGSWSQHSSMVELSRWTPMWLLQLAGISGLSRSLMTSSFMLSTHGCSFSFPNGGSYSRTSPVALHLDMISHRTRAME